ncbi:uncharacterized protein [Pseudorasbora parva]|uniref:uncharacterized protein n=1 Tax=Pseudorasbora parva TaxID=51549 RepID=UPI00351ED10F
MFHIVEFIESSEVEVVPSSWVQNGTCAWPTYKSVAKIQKAVTLHESPNHTWSAFRVRIIHSTDTYQEARLKLPQATLMSDLQTEDDDDDDDRPKRNHSSEDDEENYFASKRLEKTVRIEDHSEVFAAPQIPSPPRTMVEPLRTPSRHTDGIASPTTSRNNLRPCTSAVGDGDRTCCSSSCVSLLTEVLKAQEVIKQQLAIILKNQQKQNSAQSQSDELPDITTFNLPLSDLSDLERLENQIKDQPEQMKKLVTYLGTIGGFSTKEAVWRILGKLLTNSLAKIINWSGANQKVAFRALALRTIVVNAVRTNAHTKSSTDKEVERYITRWLQLAPDRDGGRKERAKSNVLNV